jgi:NADPH:quinone reductase-like Zn-dependent oxidoreductase
MTLAASLKEQYDAVGDCRIVHLPDLAVDSTASASYIFLPEIDGPLIYGISDSNFSLLQNVFKSARSILWVSDGADTSPRTSLISGLQRIYRAENESLPFATFSLANGSVRPSTAVNIARIMECMRGGRPAVAEGEYEERDGLIHIRRVVETSAVNEKIIQASSDSGAEPRRFDEKPTRALALGFERPGLLNTVQFYDDLQAREPLQEDEIEIAVKYSGVNFRDLLTALGQLNDTTLGLEAAGFVTRAGAKSGFSVGDRVYALVLGSFRTYCRCNAQLACRIPDSLGLKSAAALPIIFCTAYHALVNLARLRLGESVLIHSGAGGLGQAAIQRAQLFGAEIFVTVGTEEKRQLLIDLYKIDPSHIFSSRSVAFARSIKRLTNGRGVDVVVNSLAGEGLRASWECIAPFGRFIETGRKDIDTFGTLPMASFADDTTFASVNLVNIMRRKPGLARQLMESVLELAATSKISAPRPLQVYRLDQIEGALRFMQSGKNSGKMVIEFGEDHVVPVSCEVFSCNTTVRTMSNRVYYQTLPSSLPTYSLKSNVSYLIAGGLGGLGRTVARWMVSRGARHLILLSRAKKEDTDTLRFLDELKSAGASIATPVCDVCDQGSLAAVLEECSKTMPPIKGCIQAAMVLKVSH